MCGVLDSELYPARSGFPRAVPYGGVGESGESCGPVRKGVLVSADASFTYVP